MEVVKGAGPPVLVGYSPLTSSIFGDMAGLTVGTVSTCEKDTADRVDNMFLRSPNCVCISSLQKATIQFDPPCHDDLFR